MVPPHQALLGSSIADPPPHPLHTHMETIKVRSIEPVQLFSAQSGTKRYPIMCVLQQQHSCAAHVQVAQQPEYTCTNNISTWWDC